MRSSRALCSLFVAAVLAALLPGTAVAEQRSVTMRVANFNIHAAMDSDDVFDLDRTARAIAALDADVVGLQEVDVHWDERSQWRDVAGELADRLGMRVYFGRIYREDPPSPGEPHREYGNAVLSRHPIVSARNHRITRLSTQDPDPSPEPMPGFPRVTVLVDGTPVRVYSTHLDYRPEPDIRRIQVAETRRIIAGERVGAPVLLGDFNAPPDSPELAPLWSDLTDAWSLAGEGPGHTYPSTDPNTRIDYVAAGEDIEVTDVRVDDTTASDHRPVVADLVIPRWP